MFKCEICGNSGKQYKEIGHAVYPVTDHLGGDDHPAPGCHELVATRTLPSDNPHIVPGKKPVRVVVATRSKRRTTVRVISVADEKEGRELREVTEIASYEIVKEVLACKGCASLVDHTSKEGV